MKKFILSMAAIVAFAMTSDAQTRKGNILLGAGSQLDETAWTDLRLTPRVGFFIQDGIALGAIVNFNRRTDDGKFNPSGATTDVTTVNSAMELGLWMRYYVTNNVFAEVGISLEDGSEEVFDYLTAFRQEVINGVPQVNPDGTPKIVQNNEQEVISLNNNTTNFNLGLGYTIVWSEHFAVEPFIRLNFASGQADVYEAVVVNANDPASADNTYRRSQQDFNETAFNLGVNFSLFF